MASSLYIHIPFCSSICGYCDFTRLLFRDEWAFSYIEALLKEWEFKYGSRKFKTIYLGGGTPNCLPLPLLEKLLSVCQSHLRKCYEFTIECNPEHIRKEQVEMFARYGVNRVSLGMQTIHPRHLETMGRKHDYAQVQEAVAALRSEGIHNISIDLMVALPNETKTELEEDIDALIALGTPHVSVYTYIDESGSSWHKKGIVEASEDEQADALLLVRKRLKKAGFERYEVSSYAKKGYQSKHNLAYWKDEEYAALGLGASGYENGNHYTNTKSLPRYLEGHYIEESEPESENDKLVYYLLTNMRLKQGISFKDFQKRFGYSFSVRFENAIDNLVSRKLVKITKHRMKMTDKGLDLLDAAIVDLMLD